MILKSIWVMPHSINHPELENHEINNKLLALKILDESSIEALLEKAERLRTLNFFDEPYDPPEYLQ